VREGKVSVERARDVYHVAITDTGVDPAETAKLRGDTCSETSQRRLRDVSETGGAA
jgi:hypothetical protein